MNLIKRIALLLGVVALGLVLADMAKVILADFVRFETDDQQLQFEENNQGKVGTINTPLFLQVLKPDVLDQVEDDQLATIGEKFVIWWDKRAPSALTSYYKK